MTGSRLVRVFLALNAAFSLGSGLVLIFMPDTVSKIVFADPGTWGPTALLALGVGLTIFALTLFVLAANRFIGKHSIVAVSLADFGWVLGSAVLVFGFGDILEPTGVLVIDIVAAFVAVFAIGQIVGTRRIVSPGSRVSLHRKGGALTFCVRRRVRAPAAAVWSVMTDHPRYADVASNTSKVEVISGSGLGMQRRCYGAEGERWMETCDRYEEGRAFGFRVHTEAPDYPYPIAQLNGLWCVVPRSDGAEFSIRIDATPKGGFFARILFSLVAGAKFKAVLIDLAEAWAARMETQSPQPSMPHEVTHRTVPAPEAG